jgi:spore coat protein A
VTAPRITRRALLGGSAGVAASLAVVPAAWRLRACTAGEATRDVSARVPPGGMCASPARRSGATAAVAPPRAPLHQEALASFVDPLPIPPLLRPAGTAPDPTDASRELPLYRVAMREAEVRVHRDLPPTRMWTYEGAMPGPTLEMRRGHGVLVEWTHALPDRHLLPVDPTLHGAGPGVPEVRAVVHVHGAKAPPASDGYPEDWLVRGQSRVAHFPCDQEAATPWYHDHAMGLERLNQYAGLLGCCFVRDDVEDALDLPRGDHEIPLVLCDRLFYADGQLDYPTSGDPAAPWVPELRGDATLVNGKLRPYLEVQPRAYRFRVVNASNGRTFALVLPGLAAGQPMRQIGTDQGLLPAPVDQDRVTLAPAERADLVVDFAGAEGRRLVLKDGYAPLLEIRVSPGPPARPRPLPSALRPIARIDPALAAAERTLTLDEYHDPRTGRMLMLLDGKYWHDPISERPVLGSVEIWSLVNRTEDAHPVHLHLVRFLVLDRQLVDVDDLTGQTKPVGPRVPPPPGEAGWKDTVRVDPGTITRIVARFDGWPGRYVWHCHLLEHAAREMMRPFEVMTSV